MMLESKTAVIYGGGGAIGGAVARAFAEAGARVYLAGRSRARLEKVASDIGDVAGVAEVDVLDERAVAEHADHVAAEAGGIDIALNAVSFPFVHDTPFAELTVEDVMHADRRLPADQPRHGQGGRPAHDGARVGDDPDAVGGRVPGRRRPGVSATAQPARRSRR